jgi:hypothetical protein
MGQGDRFVRRFIRMHGIASLFDVHENLFWRYVPDSSRSLSTSREWRRVELTRAGCCVPIAITRCFYAKTGSAAVNISLTIEMMQECGRCIEIILGRAVRALR